ncbi:hypothetical protein PLESTF_000747300 [Pleodorina starrii]|nr:hypothetical protein PLESTM_001812600 [Pleodorina starrii]GLC68870.1 hypothetical protein PLESTF_000747300 [Pleodorina starrii]
MGCWCSSARPPHDDLAPQESPFTCTGAVAAARTQAVLTTDAAKSSFQLADQGLLPTLRSHRDVLGGPSLNANSGLSNGKEPSIPAGGALSTRNSLQQARPSDGCLAPNAPSFARPMRGAEFEDHAPPEAEEALEGDGGEILCGVATLAADLRDAVGDAATAAAAKPPGDGGGGGGDSFSCLADGDSGGSDLMKSSRRLLHSVVPLLLNPSTVGTANPDPHPDLPLHRHLHALPGGAPPRIPPAKSAPRLPRPAASAAAPPPDHPQPHPGTAASAAAAAMESSQQHTTTTTTAAANAAATRRPTFTRGLTRDSFLLNNTTGGGTTAASGYMLRTATGRGELIHVEASWIPFQMGNPLQVQVGELLGRGGCGSVYAGRWRGRPVAVKVVQQVVAPPAGAAAAVAAAAGVGVGDLGGGGALPPPTITPLIDFFGSSSGASPHDNNNDKNGNDNGGTEIKGTGGGGGGGGGARAPYLPDAHASVKRLRHPHVLRTYAYAVLSAAPQLGGVLPARHEHHVVLELCDGGTLRSWLDTIYRNGGPGGGGGSGGGDSAAATAGGGGGGGPTGAAGGGGGGPAALTATAGAGAAGREAPQCPPPPPSPSPPRCSGGGGGEMGAIAAAQTAARSAFERAKAHLNTRGAGPSGVLGAAPGGAVVGGGAEGCCGGVENNAAGRDAQPMDEPQQPHPHPQLQRLGQREPGGGPQGPAAAGTAAAAASGGAAAALSSSPGSGAPPGIAAAPSLAAEWTGAAPDRPSAAAEPTAAAAAAAAAAARKASHAGDLEGDGDGAGRLSHAAATVSEATSRRLPGLTPAQSEQLQLLGMTWVSDSGAKIECRASGCSARGLRGGGGGGDGGDGREADGGIAVCAASESSMGTARAGQLDVAAATGSGGSGGGGGAAAADGRSPPPSAPLSDGDGDGEGLTAHWADATMRANASVGSGYGYGSTMVRPESSSYAVGFHAVQQHCVVLDDYLDDDDGGADGATGGGAAGGDMYDGSSGVYGSGGGGARANAALFGDLRLHARLGLLEEGSAEGRLSTRSRCASAAATTTSTAATTTTPTDNTVGAAGGGALPLLRRHPTHTSMMSSGGAAGAAASAISTGNFLAAAPPPALVRMEEAAAREAQEASRHSEHSVGFEEGLDQSAAPPRLVSSSPPADAGGGGGGTAAAAAQARSLRPATATGQRQQQPAGFQTPWAVHPAAVGAPPPTAPSGPPPRTPASAQPQPPAANGEVDTSAATALLNRRAVGMVNSIMRAAAAAAAAGPAAAAGGGGGAATATAIAAAAEPMLPAQLRHLVTALGCLVEVASGLSYLHGIGMVHGDVKSGNVLLKLDPRQPRGFVLKLADFGFSRVLEHGSHTYLSRPSGTLAYLSPEMVTSYRQSAAADQYAFGLLVWELVTTQPLFRRLQTPQLLYAKTHNADWQHLQWPPWCPPEVEGLARRCTDYHPAARLTAAEARTQLEAMRAHYQGVLSRTVGTSGDVNAVAPAAAATATTAAPVAIVAPAAGAVPAAAAAAAAGSQPR